MNSINSIPTFKIKETVPSGIASITKATPVDVTPSIISDSDSDNWFSGSMIVRVILVVLVLSFLGFNLFDYLGDITQVVSDFLKPIVSSFSGLVAYITGNMADQTLDIAAGAGKSGIDAATALTESSAGVIRDVGKGAIDVTAGAAKSGVGLLTPSALPSGPQFMHIDDHKERKMRVDRPVPQADSSSSGTQSRTTGKGFCFIGEDRGFRTCLEVESSDKCMSGEIFPTRDVCINPSLRV
jgi:hypothetical protein